MINPAVLPSSLEQPPVYNINLHVISSNSVNKKDDLDQEPSIKEKITQISACILMITGAFFILASAGLFASSLLTGPASAMLGEVMYPLGVLSLMAGLSLFQDNKNALKISSRLGPVSISL